MKHQKITNILTVVLFVLPLALGLILFVALPDSSFSEQENRSLEQMPKLDSESFFSGGFSKAINVYYADQFPLRDIFVTLKSGSELAFLKGENNGVLYSRNQLAVKDFNAAPVEEGSVLYIISVVSTLPHTLQVLV